MSRSTPGAPRCLPLPECHCSPVSRHSRHTFLVCCRPNKHVGRVRRSLMNLMVKTASGFPCRWAAAGRAMFVWRACARCGEARSHTALAARRRYEFGPAQPCMACVEPGHKARFWPGYSRPRGGAVEAKFSPCTKIQF
jgi:hypothetical protein